MFGQFTQIGGAINIFSGVILLIYWYAFAIFLPYSQLSNSLAILVSHRHWAWINALGVIGALFGLLGQTSIYIIQIEEVGWLGLSGYLVASTGTTLYLGTMLWDTILMPILVKYDAGLLDFQGPIYSSKTFLPYFILSGIIYSSGYILVGIGITRAAVLPETGGLLLAIGAPLFGLGAIFGKFQVYVRSLGVTLLCVGLIWLGLGMI